MTARPHQVPAPSRDTWVSRLREARFGVRSKVGPPRPFQDVSLPQTGRVARDIRARAPGRLFR